MENHNSTKDVATATKEFGASRFQMAGILALSIERLTRRRGYSRAMISDQALGGIVKKMKSLIDDAQAEIVRAKYTGLVKDCPPL